MGLTSAALDLAITTVAAAVMLIWSDLCNRNPRRYSLRCGLSSYY